LPSGVGLLNCSNNNSICSMSVFMLPMFAYVCLCVPKDALIGIFTPDFMLL